MSAFFPFPSFPLPTGAQGNGKRGLGRSQRLLPPEAVRRGLRNAAVTGRWSCARCRELLERSGRDGTRSRTYLTPDGIRSGQRIGDVLDFGPGCPREHGRSRQVADVVRRGQASTKDPGKTVSDAALPGAPASSLLRASVIVDAPADHFLLFRLK